jgi:hypothetical protein
MRRFAMVAALVAGALTPLTAVPASAGQSVGYALELTANGSFEEPLTSGWQVSLPDTGSTITRDVGFEPDPDYEVQVLKVRGTATTGIDQIFPLPDLNMQFSVRAKLMTDTGYVSWAAAGIVLEYIDEGGLTLGKTAICAVSRSCPWESGPDFHLIEPWTSDWDTYSFNLGEELATYLPAVNPLEVNRLRISVMAVLDDC